MTDSGTFQTYQYKDIKIDPLEIVKFQRDIGSDIGTILDVFGMPNQTEKKAKGFLSFSKSKRTVRQRSAADGAHKKGHGRHEKREASTIGTCIQSLSIFEVFSGTLMAQSRRHFEIL